MKFNLVMLIIGGIILVILGIVIIAFGQVDYGVIISILGGIFIVLTVANLNKHNESQVRQKKQTEFVQNIHAIDDLENQVAVTVKVNDSLKRGKFSVFLNNVKVGNICIGEELKFNATKEKNLVKVGKLNGSPFKWPESGYEFDATQVQNAINIEITHENLLIMLKRI